MPSVQESQSPRQGMYKEGVYRRGIQTKRQGEARPQVCLPKGLGLHVFKDKGSGCREVYTRSGMCWLDMGRRECRPFSACVYIQESCLFLGYMFIKWQQEHDKWGGEGGLRVCHPRVYFHSLPVLSARLQEFFPICSSQSSLFLLVTIQLLQNHLLNQSGWLAFP